MKARPARQWRRSAIQLALALERLADVQKELASGQNNLMQGKSSQATEIISI